MIQSSNCLSDVDVLLSQVNVLLSEINVKLSSCRDVKFNQLLPRVGNILSEMEFIVKLSQVDVDTSTNEVDDVINTSMGWDHNYYHNIYYTNSWSSSMFSLQEFDIDEGDDKVLHEGDHDHVDVEGDDDHDNSF